MAGWLGSICPLSQGKCHPPKKRATQTALVVIMSLVPWDQLDPQMSPFVMMFDKIGVPGAASIINIVVITAAASSCNGGIFSTGRMLYSLALEGQAPKVFGKLSARHVPVAGVHASVAVMLIGVVLGSPASGVRGPVIAVMRGDQVLACDDPRAGRLASGDRLIMIGAREADGRYPDPGGTAAQR